MKQENFVGQKLTKIFWQQNKNKSYSDSGEETEAAEVDLDSDSDMFEADDDDPSMTDSHLESSTESVSEGREGDRPENASSTTSKKEPRTPETKRKSV